MALQLLRECVLSAVYRHNARGWPYWHIGTIRTDYLMTIYVVITPVSNQTTFGLRSLLVFRDSLIVPSDSAAETSLKKMTGAHQ